MRSRRSPKAEPSSGESFCLQRLAMTLCQQEPVIRRILLNRGHGLRRLVVYHRRTSVPALRFNRLSPPPNRTCPYLCIKLRGKKSIPTRVKRGIAPQNKIDY